MLMSAQVILHAPKAVRERLLQPLLTTLFPWTLHHHHSLRQAHCSVLVATTFTRHIPAPRPNPNTAHPYSPSRCFTVFHCTQGIRTCYGRRVSLHKNIIH